MKLPVYLVDPDVFPEGFTGSCDTGTIIASLKAFPSCKELCEGRSHQELNDCYDVTYHKYRTDMIEFFYKDSEILLWLMFIAMELTALVGLFIIFTPRLRNKHPYWLYSFEMLSLAVYYLAYMQLPLAIALVPEKIFEWTVISLMQFN